jgi:alpha-L-rhamnosidase
VYVVDFGQKFAGVVRLQVSGQPGQRITLHFAERLNSEGTIHTPTDHRATRGMDTYICKGKATEVWQPRFAFHKFQYVEITGMNSSPGNETLTGVALSGDGPGRGESAGIGAGRLIAGD